MSRSFYSKINYTLERLDKFLYEQDNSIPKLDLSDMAKPFTEVTKEDKPKVYPKDSELLRKLIYQSNNDKTTSFLKNILDNKYPTITQKQKDVIDSIANSMYV